MVYIELELDGLKELYYPDEEAERFNNAHDNDISLFLYNLECKLIEKRRESYCKDWVTNMMPYHVFNKYLGISDESGNLSFIAKRK